MDKARRRELKEQYLQQLPEAGVYRIVNTQTGKMFIGSSTNLTGVRNKLDFGRSQGSASVLHHRLRKDAAAYGLDAFIFDVIERLDVTPEMTTEQIRADLDALEALCREQVNPELLY